jgi:hypothetical protein
MEGMISSTSTSTVKRPLDFFTKKKKKKKKKNKRFTSASANSALRKVLLSNDVLEYDVLVWKEVRDDDDDDDDDDDSKNINVGTVLKKREDGRFECALLTREDEDNNNGADENEIVFIESRADKTRTVDVKDCVCVISDLLAFEQRMQKDRRLNPHGEHAENVWVARGFDIVSVLDILRDDRSML